MRSICWGVFAATVVTMLSSVAAASSTPAGFQPKVFPIVQVIFTRTRANPPGRSLKEGLVQKAPSLALPESGSASYLALMLDISVQTSDSSKNTTRLHWVQNNLTSSEPASGPALFTSTAPLVEYYAPGPPGGQSHTYVVLVYQQPSGWVLPDNEAKHLAKINAAVSERIDFDLAKFVQAAGLADPVAADYFLVTTYSQQPSSSVTTPTPSNTGGETPTGKAVSGTDGSNAGSAGPTETGVPSGAAGGCWGLRTASEVVVVGWCAMGFLGIWASGIW